MPSPLSACEACGRRWRGEGRATASSSESRTRAQGGWWEHPLSPSRPELPPKASCWANATCSAAQGNIGAHHSIFPTQPRFSYPRQHSSGGAAGERAGSTATTSSRSLGAPVGTSRTRRRRCRHSSLRRLGPEGALQPTGLHINSHMVIYILIAEALLPGMMHVLERHQLVSQSRGCGAAC